MTNYNQIPTIRARNSSPKKRRVIKDRRKLSREEGKPQESVVKIPPKRIKSRMALLNVALLVGIVGTIVLFFWADRQRQSALDRLEETEQKLEEIRTASTEEGSQEISERVLNQARQHILISENSEPTIATITDVESLRSTHDFYGKANNGDHVIITSDRAILYDPVQDIIIDVFPISLTSAPGPESSIEENNGIEGSEIQITPTIDSSEPPPETPSFEN